MPLPSQILMLAAALVLWALGRGAAPDPPAPPARNPLGVAASPYGELWARLLRPGLHEFWHLGRHAHGAPEAPESLPSGPAGRLLALKESLEASNTPVRPTAGLRRFAAAAADRRLQRALHLAPADWVLLDVHLESQLGRLEREPHRRAALEATAAAAIARGSRPDATLSEALAGAGAASTLIELESLPEETPAPAGPPAPLAALESCLQRYREREQEALAQGWWSSIPEMRRAELSRQARILETFLHSFRATRQSGPTRPPGAPTAP